MAENKNTAYQTYRTNDVANNMSLAREGAADKAKATEGSNKLFNDILHIPNWSLMDFIDLRTKFRRQMLNDSPLSLGTERGNYFYRLYFNFNTGHGLFGSLIKTQTNQYAAEENNAYRYLSNNISSPRFSADYKMVLNKKRESLEKFGALLNYITNECPWFFKEVGGLAEATQYNFKEVVLDKEKEITLSFNPDAIDMRIGTLLDLYKDACYDVTNFREIIPENLRKFDMCIALFNPPIIDYNFKNNRNLSGLPTSTFEEEISNGKKGKREKKEKKTFNAAYTTFGRDDYNDITKIAGLDNSTGAKDEHNDVTTMRDELSKTKLGFNIAENILSFKCLVLKNCEFDFESMASFPEVVNNENGFTTEYVIKIKYQRSYSVNVNRELGVQTLEGLFKEFPKVVIADPNGTPYDGYMTKQEYSDSIYGEYEENPSNNAPKGSYDYFFGNDY